MSQQTKPADAAREFLSASRSKLQAERDMERARIQCERSAKTIEEARGVLIRSVSEEVPLRVFDCSPGPHQVGYGDASHVVVHWTAKGVTITVTKPETAQR